jgi:hypothetical protein
MEVARADRFGAQDRSADQPGYDAVEEPGSDQIIIAAGGDVGLAGRICDHGQGRLESEHLSRKAAAQLTCNCSLAGPAIDKDHVARVVPGGDMGQGNSIDPAVADDADRIMLRFVPPGPQRAQQQHPDRRSRTGKRSDHDLAPVRACNQMRGQRGDITRQALLVARERAIIELQIGGLGTASAEIISE